MPDDQQDGPDQLVEVDQIIELPSLGRFFQILPNPSRLFECNVVVYHQNEPNRLLWSVAVSERSATEHGQTDCPRNIPTCCGWPATQPRSGFS